MRGMLAGLARSEAGAVAPTVALSLFGLIAAGGLAFDYARLASLDTELQNAADHAALAAASQLDGEAGACLRAAQAASAMVANETRFANDKTGANQRLIVVANEAACDAAGTIRFYQDKPKTTPATSDANARFVQVAVETRRANYALTPIVGALNSGNLTGTAYAGLGSAICKVPPLMMCNPDETGPDSDFVISDYAGKGILAKSGGSGAWAPGNFGFLEVGAQPSADQLREAFGYANSPFQCVSTNGVDTAPGNMAAVSTAINTRFDIYENGWAAGCGSGACPPANNTVKDLVRPTSSAACNLSGSGWHEVSNPGTYRPDPVSRSDATVDAMGHPRDICHAVTLDGDCLPLVDGNYSVIGDGNWDRDTYFRVNHGLNTTAEWQAATGKTNPTRYETYIWELGGHLGNRAVGSDTSYKAPQCGTGVGPPISGQVDRRVTSVAVVNCASQSVNGHSLDVAVLKWIDVFLVEPSIDRGNGSNKRTTKDEIYVEIIGPTINVGNNQNPQVIRRDVPYLIE